LLLVLAQGEHQDAGDGATATIPASITPSIVATPAVPIVATPVVPIVAMEVVVATVVVLEVDSNRD
jgi:hypothetical protein